MAWKPIEQWLDKGWSLPRLAWGIITGVLTVLAVVGYAVHPHHAGAVWWVVLGLVILVIWAVFEMLRWRIRHNRMERRLEEQTAPDQPQRGPDPTKEGSLFGVENAFTDEPELLEHSGAEPYAPPAASVSTPESEPSKGPDSSTQDIADENEEVPEADEEWFSMEEETDDGFVLRVVRPAGDSGRLSRCTVLEIDETERRWSHVLTAKGGLNIFGEHGFNLAEWQLEFPGDFRGGSALMPLGSARYAYRWIANYGEFFGNPVWRTVASGEFGR